MEEFYIHIARALNDSPPHFTFLCDDFNAKIGLKIGKEEIMLGNFGTLGRNKDNR